jgi:hypothetical protein
LRATRLVTDAEEPLTDLTFYADWDPVVSMISSLRIHLFEYGTIPTWNFMFCGGKPELAIPYSWAWTWPSLIGYAMPPVYAIFVVWIVMTLIGFFSLRALLIRWSGDALGASVGAGVYALGGYFASHFNAGHITFAFFHWIPLLIYLFDVTFDRVLEGRRVAWLLCATILASALFISAGLPHPLLHFYPALLLFIVYRTIRTAMKTGFPNALRAATLPVVANLLGIGLAAYKLVPVIAWQRQFPREGVLWESYDVFEVLANTVLFVADYLTPGEQEPWHLYPPWGYNAYVGIVPWLCAAAALVAACQFLRRRRGERGMLDGPANAPASQDDGLVFALLLVVIGIALSMGNDNSSSPAYLFRYLPILDGIRAFNRYQILIVFGLAILTAGGFAAVKEWLGHRGSAAIVLRWALALGALGPIAAQAFLLATSIPVASNDAIAAKLGLERAGDAPKYIRAHKPGVRVAGHQTTILEYGHWVGNCYTNITLPEIIPRSVKYIQPISFPPPKRLVGLESNRIALEYDPVEIKLVRLDLRILEEFETSIPLRTWKGRKTFVAGELPDGLFTITTDYAGLGEGRRSSAIAVVLTALFLGLVWRAERPRPARQTSAARNSS